MQFPFSLRFQEQTHSTMWLKPFVSVHSKGSPIWLEHVLYCTSKSQGAAVLRSPAACRWCGCWAGRSCRSLGREPSAVCRLGPRLPSSSLWPGSEDVRNEAINSAAAHKGQGDDTYVSECLRTNTDNIL